MSGVRHLAESPWTEVESWERHRLVAILPVGATEAHGPHLPLATDGVIAAAMAEEGARRLAGRGLLPVVLPGVDYSPAPFAAGFAGTISIRPATLTALLVEIAASLAAQGVPVLAIANAHLDPAHLGALRDAVSAIRLAGSPRVAFADLTRRRWARRLTEEFRSGACHAGRFEGSIVLAARPELVRESRRDLPEVPLSLSEAIRAGKKTFEEAGGDRAYFGDPAAATADEGRATIELLGTILEQSVIEELEPDRPGGEQS